MAATYAGINRLIRRALGAAPARTMTHGPRSRRGKNRTRQTRRLGVGGAAGAYVARRRHGQTTANQSTMMQMLTAMTMGSGGAVPFASGGMNYPTYGGQLVSQGPDNCRIRGTVFVTNVKGPASSNDADVPRVPVRTSLAPRVFGGSWLAKQAELYETYQYVPSKTRLVYRPIVPGTVGGQLCGYVDTDPSDVSGASTQTALTRLIMSNSRAAMWNVGAKQVMPMPPAAQSKYYTSVDSKSDLRLTDQYTVTIAQSADLTNFAAGPVGDASAPAVTLGTLVLEYECILRTPQLSGNESVGGVGGSTDVVTVALGGDTDSAQITTGNLLRIAIPAGQTLYVFPPSVENGPIDSIGVPDTTFFCRRSLSDSDEGTAEKTVFYSDKSGNDTISVRKTLILSPLAVDTHAWISVTTIQAGDTNYLTGVSFSALSDKPVEVSYLLREPEWYNTSEIYDDTNVAAPSSQSDPRHRSRSEVREARLECVQAAQAGSQRESEATVEVIDNHEDSDSEDECEFESCAGLADCSQEVLDRLLDQGKISFPQYREARAWRVFAAAMREGLPSFSEKTRGAKLPRPTSPILSDDAEYDEVDDTRCLSPVYVSMMCEDPAHG